MPISGSQKSQKLALAGVLRAATGRANGVTPAPCVSIAGVQYATSRGSAAQEVLEGSISITENNTSDANTCEFQVRGFLPTYGQDVIVTLGSTRNNDRQFAGNIHSITSTYEGTPANATHRVHCVDYSWHLTRVLVAAKYTGLSATAIAQALVALVPGFTSFNVAAGLATIDEISFTFDTVLSALVQLANRIGTSSGSAGFVKVDYLKDVHFGLTDSSTTPPVTITSSSTTLDSLAPSYDLDHVITEVLVEGGGGNALSDVAVGDTILPVDNADWYNDGGGVVVCGPQRIAYAGVDLGGGGAVVGPGQAPTAAPAVVAVAGTGITSGSHSYAFTWVTGAGESLPSPLASFVTYTIAGPVSAPSVDQTVGAYGTNQYSAGDTVQRIVTYSRATSPTDFTQESTSSPTSSVTAVSPPPPLAGISTANADRVTFPHSSDASVTRVHMWRKVNAGSFLLAYTAANVPSTSADFADSSASSADVLPSGAGTYEQAALSSIAVGPGGTTSRKVYRTADGGTQLKLLTTIANNTGTTYTDSTADGSLGANAPTSDTSGLAQPSGQVNAGAAALLVAGAGAFNPSGGWAVIGNGQQVIRYTGISGNNLTGIPASGIGAITATIAYNSSATAAPALIGLSASAIVYTIAKGDPVNLLVQADDLSAQAVIATAIGGSDTGVIPSYQRDGRISETEARARATATLAQHSAVDVSVSGSSRDLNVRAGRALAVNVTQPRTVNASFVIQSVTITNFQPAINPTRTFASGIKRVEFADLIRFVSALSR